MGTTTSPSFNMARSPQFSGSFPHRMQSDANSVIDWQTYTVILDFDL